MNISNKDVMTFGKVLSAIGEYLQAYPECLIKILTENNYTKTEHNNSSRSDIEAINFFKIAQENKSDEKLFDIIIDYPVGDLRLLIKKHHWGSVKSQKKEDIVNHIIGKLRKHFEDDVFKEYTMTSLKDDAVIAKDGEQEKASAIDI